MPCTVDTSFEDSKWQVAIHEHHIEIEAILEQLLNKKITLSKAREKTVASKIKLADAYVDSFKSLMNEEALKKGRKNILGKWGK